MNFGLNLMYVTRRQKNKYVCIKQSIGNPNIVTIPVNPNEYFRKYKDESFNKKRKRLRKDTPGMHFETYENRVMLRNGFTNQKVKRT